MTKESTTYSNEQLRQLIDSYFEGSIPPAQLERLLDVSKAYAKGDLPINDRQVAEELLTISAIENYAKATLLSLEAKVPTDLESRLDSHISQLASRSRKKWLWLKAGSAAACVALLITTGLHFLSPNITQPASQPKAQLSTVSAIQPTLAAILPVQSEVEDISEPETVSKEFESTRIASPILVASSASTPTIANIPINKVKKTGASSSRKRNKPLATSHTLQLPYPMPETTIPDIAGSIVIPETLPHIQGVMPSLLAAKAEIEELIATPFVTIGQTFDKAVESLNVVNATMYEANKTAAALSQEFLEASTSPLRSI